MKAQMFNQVVPIIAAQAQSPRSHEHYTKDPPVATENIMGSAYEPPQESNVEYSTE